MCKCFDKNGLYRILNFKYYNAIGMHVYFLDCVCLLKNLRFVRSTSFYQLANVEHQTIYN